MVLIFEPWLSIYFLLGVQKVKLFLFIGDAVDSENEDVVPEPKVSKETIDFKEVKRIDHILGSLQRKVCDH